MTSKYSKCKINQTTRKISDVDASTLEGLTSQSKDPPKYDRIDGYNYQTNLVVFDTDTLFKIARKLWRQAEDVVLNESSCNCDMDGIKKQLTNLFSHCYRTVHDYQNTTVVTSLINELMWSLEIFKRSVFRWCDLDDRSLTLLASQTVLIEDEPISRYFHMYLEVNDLILSVERLVEADVEATVRCIMADLIKISRKIFDRNESNTSDVQPFPCHCVKKLWWRLLNLKSWPTFNALMTGKDEEFSVWLLLHVATLQNNDVNNFALIEEILRSLTNSIVCDDSKLLRVLRLADPLLNDVWIDAGKLEPYLVLWEYFYKNLNGGIDELPKSYKDVMETIDGSCKTGYEFFVSMLRRHLVVHPRQWSKLRGRVYSRLPPHKMNEYDDGAVYRISLLFLTLAGISVGEVEKLHSLLGGLSDGRRDTEVVWIVYIAMIIVSLRENQDVTTPAIATLKLLLKVSEHREQFYLIRNFVDALTTIMNVSDDFDLNQHLLIGPWVGKYIVSCSHNDLCALLNTFVWILERVENHASNYISSYIANVLPSLKQMAVGSVVPPQIGKLAAMLSLRSDSSIRYFCGDVNVKVTNQFLCTLLKDDPDVGNDEQILIQAWIKCCLLCVDFNNEDLSKKVFKLHTIENVIADIDVTKEPLHAFIDALKSSQANPNRLRELCEICFGGIDKWVGAYLMPSTPEAQIFNLYTDISLLFYNCAPLVYHKFKSTCLLNRLVTVLLLPMDVLMGRPPHPNILKPITRTWHLFVKGIFKLDYTSDAYVERTLKDLIIRYVPHFPIANSPIVKIMDVNDLLGFALDKISNAFLLRIARNSEDNAAKAIRTVRSVLESTRDEDALKLVVRKVLVGVFEVIMFSGQKNIAIDLLKFVASSDWYEHVREDVRVSINVLTEKHLAFNANNYFNFVVMLIKIIRVDVMGCVPHIKKHVGNVERMRGVGFDNTLRQGLDRIESALSL